MDYCKRCCYPANTKPMIIFDEQGVCSGCRYAEQKEEIDWPKRKEALKELLAKYSKQSRKNGTAYDCIIPVGGGKDSHFQTYIIKKVLGFNPLLVTYNHCFNTALGIRNLTNLVSKLGCDLLRFTTNPQSVKKIARYMLRKVGDITWHYHAGIRTFPLQAAARFKIPLIVWGEPGYAEMFGMFRHDEMVEFSEKVRREHDMRGFEPVDILEDPANTEITAEDLAAFYYPTEEEIEQIGVRGIYLSNYIKWDAKKQADFLINHYGFETAVRKERTFNLHAKTDDAANDVHDYLKYLKFGYGRATDDTATEIRLGRMTREEGIAMVKKYDAVKPSTLDVFLKFLGLTEQEFFQAVEHLRDSQIWQKNKKGEWLVKDSVVNHINDPGVEEARLPQSRTRTHFSVQASPVSHSRGEADSQDSFIIL